MRKGIIVKKCPDCRDHFGCSDTRHQICNEDCTTKEDCEILAKAKHSELELCPTCASARKTSTWKLPETVRKFLAG